MRSTVSAPTPSTTCPKTQPNPLAEGSISGLLGLIREVRAERPEIQAQQAAAAQDGQGSLVANAVESTTQQSVAGQPTVTTTHSGQPITST